MAEADAEVMAAAEVEVETAAPAAAGGDQGASSSGEAVPAPEKAAAATDSGPASYDEAQEMLKKLARVPKPNQDEHRAKVEAINDEIKRLLDEMDAVKQQIDGLSQQRSGAQSEMSEARGVMSQLLAERDALRGELDGIQSQRESSKAKMDAHSKKKRQMQSDIKYTDVADIDAAVRKLERQQQTTSMSLPEEKKLLKEISMLKEARKTLASMTGQDDSIREAKDQHSEIRKSETDKRAELRVLQEKIKVQYTVLDQMSKTREGEPNPIKDLVAKKNALREAIGEKKAAQRELHQKNKAANDEFYQNSREQRRLKEALRRFEKEAQTAEWEERRRAMEAEEAKKIPYEEEMALCDQLLTYLQVNFVPKAEAKAVIGNGAPAPPADSASDEFEGKVLVVKKRSDEEYLVGTGGKGGKKKGKAAGGKSGPGRKGKGDAIVHALDTIESFSVLSLEPPNSKSAVQETMEALRAKKEWYSQQPRGSVPKASNERSGSTESSKKDQARPEKKGGKAPEITEEAFPSLPGAPKVASPPSAPEEEDEGSAAVEDDKAAAVEGAAVSQ